MAASHTPNHHLRALIGETGWSGEQFAREVNRVGRASGLALRYDRTSVAHWLSGSKPGHPVPALVAEVLSRALRREITVEQTHLLRVPGPPPAPGADQVFTTLARPTSGRGRPGPVYTVTGPGVAPYARPTATWGAGAAPQHPPSIGTEHVQAVKDLYTAFSTMEENLGGGRARPALAGFLGSSLTTWLHAPAPPRIRRALLRNASQLAYLAGFMCFDELNHGAAQAYYGAAARLAAEAADPAAHAVVLRALSVQAHYLGYRAHALDLARAAAGHLSALTVRQQSFVLGQYAVAAAGTGDRRAAFAHLERTRQLLESSDSGADGFGHYHWAAYAHQEAETLATLGDSTGALAALGRSLRERPAAERRARAVTTARAAELYLDRGHLDRACAAWQTVLDDCQHLDSARLRGAVAGMRTRLQTHRTSPAARTLLERARALAEATRSRQRPS
ncbi:hypothetical protein OHV05_02555 [Kitasatospora sp. NBC_00070]|uniref:hypothetical protein n=1 Tax=Kitasatospora sp. NBC_00070 TaxID=2975962 RepID=UPI00324674A4